MSTTAAGTPDVSSSGALVLLVGVSPVYAHGLCSALERGGLRARSVRRAEDLETAVPAGQPCAVVAPMPLTPALRDALSGLASENLRLVLLLTDDDPAGYLKGLRAGALSLVPAGARLPELVAVISGAVRGYTCLPPAVVRSLCRSLLTEPVPELPAREREWLRLIAEGVTVAVLAARTACSEREMYRLLGGLYRRLGATNRTEALFAAQRSGLLAG